MAASASGGGGGSDVAGASSASRTNETNFSKFINEVFSSSIAGLILMCKRSIVTLKLWISS